MQMLSERIKQLHRMALHSVQTAQHRTFNKAKDGEKTRIIYGTAGKGKVNQQEKLLN